MGTRPQRTAGFVRARRTVELSRTGKLRRHAPPEPADRLRRHRVWTRRRTARGDREWRHRARRVGSRGRLALADDRRIARVRSGDFRWIGFLSDVRFAELA